ncbi:uncharacterized protein LOC123520461 [Portunus trituberculatus]|uniref:uncharacterized protein LOC123520461 n=1 Tax=Portunus trituberculatus TaxID=210409 RepID=UPI001E1D085B|nr:uncharacterized protein LOC123520461 [Portunus trituberculatus]
MTGKGGTGQIRLGTAALHHPWTFSQTYVQDDISTLSEEGFWRSSRTLHTAFLNVCAECKTESGKDGGCFNIDSIIGSGFLCLWKIVDLTNTVHQITSLHVGIYLATRSNGS